LLIRFLDTLNILDCILCFINFCKSLRIISFLALFYSQLLAIFIHNFVAKLSCQIHVVTFTMLFAIFQLTNEGIVILVKQNTLSLFFVIYKVAKI